MSFFEIEKCLISQLKIDVEVDIDSFIQSVKQEQYW